MHGGRAAGGPPTDIDGLTGGDPGQKCVGGDGEGSERNGALRRHLPLGVRDLGSVEIEGDELRLSSGTVLDGATELDEVVAGAWSDGHPGDEDVGGAGGRGVRSGRHLNRAGTRGLDTIIIPPTVVTLR